MSGIIGRSGTNVIGSELAGVDGVDGGAVATESRENECEAVAGVEAVGVGGSEWW